MLDDLSTLPPKRLERRLEKLADEALPCHAVTVFDGNPDDGITAALHVDSRRRGVVLDLARVVEDDPRVHGSADWSLLPPTHRRSHWRLLLRVSFERPVQCLFTVSIDVRAHSSDPLRPTLPILLAPRLRPAAGLDHSTGRARTRPRVASRRLVCRPCPFASPLIRSTRRETKRPLGRGAGGRLTPAAATRTSSTASPQRSRAHAEASSGVAVMMDSLRLVRAVDAPR
jgi:hypothetical protein